MDELGVTHLQEYTVLADVADRSAAQISAENFPVAMRMIPKGPRAQLIKLYAFARFVDDVGDEAPGDRTALLALIEQDVRGLQNRGTDQLAIEPVRALKSLVDEFGVPIDAFLDLIEANRLDQYTAQYATFDDLLQYCRLSAAPIGRVVLHIARAVSDRNIADSDLVCAGLQVLEHCQDVGEDARAGRVYLPANDLHEAGVAGAELLAGTTSGALRGVVNLQVVRAIQLLDPGRALVGRLTGWPRLAVAGYAAGGFATAAALRKAQYDVLAAHIAPSKARTAVHALRLITGR
jgi:squalene synthase HpnC